MENYIKGNKEAWEEAFDKRDGGYSEDIAEAIRHEEYAFFNSDTIAALKKYDLSNKTIGQFCCNNGRELLSLVKATGAKAGVGFDIAENMVAYASDKAQELDIPCSFVAANVLDIDDSYAECFDAVILTIGALCWFKDMKEYFAVISKCMKKGGIIIVNDGHPMISMLAMEGEEEYDAEHPMNFAFSYFSHEWIGTGGMSYMAGKSYESKPFTDYTHSISEIIGAMCANGIVITNMQEFQYDIGNGMEHINNTGFPLSMLIEGRKDDKDI